MKFRIHWTKGEYEDSIVIEGETIEELRQKAALEIKKRNPDNYWSEKL